MNQHILLAVAFALTGCAVTSEDPQGSSSDDTQVTGKDDGAVLDFVNYPGTDAVILEDDVALDHRAAEAIVARRNGPDGVSPSSDDALFVDLAELQALPFVDATALAHLSSYAERFPAPAAERVEGVAFVGWEAEAVRWGVNRASVDELDGELGLDARAAENLHANSPFATVRDMGAMGFVGPEALEALRAHAPNWWSRMRGGAGLAGTFDGVAFDEATAQAALEIAMRATRGQLVTHDVPAGGASAIIDGRPYHDLAELAAVKGVGWATMQRLHEYAASGTWAEACEPDLAPRSDVDAGGMSRLFALASAGQAPFAEIAALEVQSCADLSDAAVRDALLAQLAAFPAIHWAGSGPLTTEDFAAGAGTFVADVEAASTALLARVESGSWSPGTPAEAKLLSGLDAMRLNITAAPLAAPGDFYAATLSIDAGACSESTTVLLDPASGAVWAIHQLPAC